MEGKRLWGWNIVNKGRSDVKYFEKWEVLDYFGFV